MRSVYHINADSTKGHILLVMFSYPIIREMEIKIFPWLKTSNKANKEQLSFCDMEEELKMIKLNILKIGEGAEKILITELTVRQNEIFKQLKIDKEGLKRCSN